MQQNNDANQRFDCFASYVEPLLRSESNVCVLSEATVHRVIFEDNAAVGIKVEVDGETCVIRSNCEVILAAGTFGSPQLLMLSGVGPAKDLGKFGIDVVYDNPNVGLNFSEHVGAAVACSLPQFAEHNDGSGVPVCGFYASEWAKQHEPRNVLCSDSC